MNYDQGAITTILRIQPGSVISDFWNGEIKCTVQLELIISDHNYKQLSLAK